MATPSQSFSLIIGSADLLYISQELFTEYVICPENRHLVHMTAMDHGGDGWESGNSYSILKSGIAIVSGTMSGSIGDDFLKDLSLCLDTGEYTVQIIQQKGDEKDEIGFEINRQVYLSQFVTSGSFSVPPKSCSNPSLYLVLVGSLAGAPYGWNGGAHYVIQRTGKSENYKGTLVTGMVREHIYCLLDGKWEISLKHVPNNDDKYDDIYAGC